MQAGDRGWKGGGRTGGILRADRMGQVKPLPSDPQESLPCLVSIPLHRSQLWPLAPSGG